MFQLTIKLVFKPVFLKQFHFLKPLNIFMTSLKYAKKVILRDANEDVDKVCIEVLKTFHNAGGKPTRGFSLIIQHKTFSALNCIQVFGNRVKESLKRNTNSNSRKVELPHVKDFHAFVSTLDMYLPSVQTKTKEDEVGMGVDWLSV